MDLSQINSNGQNGTSSITIPGLEGIQSMFGPIMIGSAVITGLFLVLYLISVIQRVRANRATIAMHKDIAAIRAILEKPADSPVPPIITEEPKPIQVPIRDESESSSTTPEHTS